MRAPGRPAYGPGTTKVSAEELETAKNYAVEVFPRTFATAAQIAGTFAQDEYTRRPADYWTTYRARIAAVTAEDVQRVAQKYMHNLRFVVLGDPARIDKNVFTVQLGE